MSLPDIREALAETLRTIPRLNATPYITDAVVAPQAMFDFELVPNVVFAEGAHQYDFVIDVYLERSHEVAAQRYLDGLRDPEAAQGLKLVLEDSDSPLSSHVHYAKVTRIGRVEPVTVGATEYLTFPCELEVVA